MCKEDSQYDRPQGVKGISTPLDCKDLEEMKEISIVCEELSWQS